MNEQLNTDTVIALIAIVTVMSCITTILTLTMRTSDESNNPLPPADKDSTYVQ
jgi:hypothetical protein